MTPPERSSRRTPARSSDASNATPSDDLDVVDLRRRVEELEAENASLVEAEARLRLERDRAGLAQDKDTRRLQELAAVVRAAAAGDLAVAVKVRGDDEVGALAESVRELFGQLRESLGGVSERCGLLGTGAESLGSVSRNMSAQADQTAQLARSAAAATDQVNRHVQTVAVATEELSSSIREIARNASEAASVATSAVRAADTTNTIVARLGDSSNDIGKVIKVITSIAQQTKLLALNATIEAARAGEAGKGFAVVANEVKELAKETGKATEDISLKIEAIQSDMSAAVVAIGQISSIIDRINDLQSAIAGAVEEQTATTQEIGRALGEAARGSTEITHHINGVAQAAQGTSSGATELQRAAQELRRLSTDLEARVTRFTH